MSAEERQKIMETEADRVAADPAEIIPTFLMNPMMINPQRGEIWLVNFNPQIGDEMGKARPALVLSVDGMSRLQLRIIIPITDWEMLFSTITPRSNFILRSKMD